MSFIPSDAPSIKLLLSTNHIRIQFVVNDTNTMATARGLCDALEREIQQLSPEFLQHPKLRQRLLDDLCKLAYNLEGSRQLVKKALDADVEKKKDYTVNQNLIDGEADGVEELTPPQTDPESQPASNRDNEPEYKSWVDSKGRKCYEVQEVEVASFGTPLRSM